MFARRHSLLLLLLLIVNYIVPFSFCLFVFSFFFSYFSSFIYIVGSLWVNSVCWVAYFKQIQIQYNTIQDLVKMSRPALPTLHFTSSYELSITLKYASQTKSFPATSILFPRHFLLLIGIMLFYSMFPTSCPLSRSKGGGKVWDTDAGPLRGRHTQCDTHAKNFVALLSASFDLLQLTLKA